MRTLLQRTIKDKVATLIIWLMRQAGRYMPSIWQSKASKGFPIWP